MASAELSLPLRSRAGHDACGLRAAHIITQGRVQCSSVHRSVGEEMNVHMEHALPQPIDHSVLMRSASTVVHNMGPMLSDSDPRMLPRDRIMSMSL